jgi:hypothetical protein
VRKYNGRPPEDVQRDIKKYTCPQGGVSGN